jgi:hypothetical protein
MVMNILGLWITPSVTTSAKDMNLAVLVSTHNVNQGIFPFVVTSEPIE